MRPVSLSADGHSNAVAGARLRAAQRDVQLCCCTSETRCGRGQVQGKAAQRAVADVHAHHRAARQQKREQVAQVELVIDAAHQHHQQGERQHPARPGGQDVDVALGQQQTVGGWQACRQPSVEALLE